MTSSPRGLVSRILRTLRRASRRVFCGGNDSSEPRPPFPTAIVSRSPPKLPPELISYIIGLSSIDAEASSLKTQVQSRSRYLASSLSLVNQSWSRCAQIFLWNDLYLSGSDMINTWSRSSAQGKFWTKRLILDWEGESAVEETIIPLKDLLMPLKGVKILQIMNVLEIPVHEFLAGFSLENLKGLFSV